MLGSLLCIQPNCCRTSPWALRFRNGPSCCTAKPTVPLWRSKTAARIAGRRCRMDASKGITLFAPTTASSSAHRVTWWKLRARPERQGLVAPRFTPSRNGREPYGFVWSAIRSNQGVCKRAWHSLCHAVVGYACPQAGVPPAALAGHVRARAGRLSSSLLDWRSQACA